MIWLAGLPVIWWAAILIADAIQPGRNLFELMEVLTEKLNHPFQLHYTEYTIKSVLVCTLLYAAGIGIFYSSQKNYRRGEEHGSARWGDARQICKKYSQKPYSQNILLTQNFRISLDTHKHRRCLNILVVGGSGAGKSRGFALPNIMQCCCSISQFAARQICKQLDSLALIVSQLRLPYYTVSESSYITSDKRFASLCSAVSGFLE